MARTHAPGPVVDGVESAISALSCKERDLATIVKTGGSCELFVGVFAGDNLAFELDNELIKKLDGCCLGISIDAYLEREGDGSDNAG